MRIFAPSKQQSVKDLPSQTRLKFRCAPCLCACLRWKRIVEKVVR